MIRQLRLIITSIQFFTRIPVNTKRLPSPDDINDCMRYFSLLGYIIALVFLVMLWAVGQVLPYHLAIIIAMLCTIITTGAFHEDGLIDFFDSFGSPNPKKALEIMKDSRVGAFGTIAIFSALLLKTALLVELLDTTKNTFHIKPDFTNLKLIYFSVIIFLSQSLSRAMASSMTLVLPYIENDASSKSKHAVAKKSFFNIGFSLVLGLIPLYFLSLRHIFILVFAELTAFVVFFTILKRKFNGYNGDCLGAAQQLFELTILMVFCARPVTI